MFFKHFSKCLNHFCHLSLEKVKTIQVLDSAVRIKSLTVGLKTTKYLSKSSHNVKNDLASRQFTQNLKLLFLLHAIKSIPVFLKSHSNKIVSNCVRSCEFVIAHRVRRSQQMLCLYSKLWDEAVMQQFINKLKGQLLKRRYILLSSSLISFYDWSKERISDEDILR